MIYLVLPEFRLLVRYPPCSSKFSISGFGHDYTKHMQKDGFYPLLLFFIEFSFSHLTLFLVVPVLLSIHPVLCSETVGRFHTPEASSRRVTASTSCNSWKSRNLKWDESAGLDFWKSGIDSYISLRVTSFVLQSLMNKKTTLLFAIGLKHTFNKSDAMMDG